MSLQINVAASYDINRIWWQNSPQVFYHYICVFVESPLKMENSAKN